MLHSYDEWTRLREVVVGSPANYVSHDRELSFELFHHENLAASHWYYPRLGQAGSSGVGTQKLGLRARYVEELAEDVEGFVSVLEACGVSILRPQGLNKSANEFTTPWWRASAIPALNVRDNTLIVGDEIIETPPMIRSRYFETQLLKPIFQQYFADGARWTVMPRPILTDASFDRSYVASVGGPVEPMNGAFGASEHDVGYEILIDGAQCIRLGRDIVVNVANANHEMGLTWLERHLRGRFRIHRTYRLSDSHLDSMVLALRPGLLLVRSESLRDKLPEALRNWRMIEAPAPSMNSFPDYSDDDLILTSPYIDLNVLSIDENTVVVNEACPELARVLEGNGFTVIPVRHRHRRIFGGGFHCFTLDTVRDGGAEDYL